MKRNDMDKSDSDDGTHQGNTDYTDEIVDTTFDEIEEEEDDNNTSDYSKGHLLENSIDSLKTQKEEDSIKDIPEKLTHKISRRKLVDFKQDSRTLEEDQNITETTSSATSEADDSDSDVGDDEADDNDDEEEELPRLKYTRMSQLPARFFKKDPVSACYFFNNLFFFATHSGFIHICKEDFTSIRTLKAHRSSILSLHSDGQYFASASIDGTVVIGSILNESEIIAYDFKRSVHAVALDRSYATTKGFFSGSASGEVIYTSKGWLGQRQDTKFDSGNGPITSLKVIDNLVIWTNNDGIKIGHIPSATLIHHEPLPKDFPSPEMYWPRIVQSSPDKFMIGWANNVWIFKITMADDDINSKHSNPNQFTQILSSASSTFKGLPEKKVALENHMVLDDTLIAGISELDDEFLILNFIPPVRKSKPESKGRGSYESSPPELKIVSKLTLNDLSVDEVGLNNSYTLGLNDYQLYQYFSRITQERKWFLVSPNDAVIVEEFNPHDQLTWLLSRSRYKHAWSMSEDFLDKMERLNIGLRQIDSYIENGEWYQAIDFLSDILYLDLDEKHESGYVERVIEEWDKWIETFVKNDKWDLTVDHIPAFPFTNDKDKQISSDIYNKFLVHYLSERNLKKFTELIYKWDHSLFEIEEMYSLLEGELREYDERHQSGKENSGSDDDNDLSVQRFLYIDLSLEFDLPENCVSHLIKLKNPEIMSFLDEHHLIAKFLNQLPEIIKVTVGEFDLDSIPIETLKQKLSTDIHILVENSHEILPNVIMRTFEKSNMDIINFLYMEQLSQVDKLLTKDFEDDIVKLYASYNRSRLLSFLTRHNDYNIEKAIKICEGKECISELVYLLSKVGQNKEALILIIDKLGDPERAISFAHSVNDKELWDFLLDYSMYRPQFVKALVVTASESIDPIPIVNRIPKGVEIEGLQKALISITSNVEMDRFIHELILKIIVGEEAISFDEYRELRARGYVIDPHSHEKMLEETIIKFADPSKPLITEKQLVGSGKEWKGTVTNHSEKITHLSYIKRLLLTSHNAVNK